MSFEHVIGGRYEDKKLVQSMDLPSTSTGKDFLFNTPVKALFPANRTKILSVEKNDSVATAFKILTENHILSVPVYDPKAGQYIGFVDILDVIVFCLKDVKDEEIQTNRNLEALVASHHVLEKATCEEVAGFSGRNSYYPIDANAPLLTAIQLMVKNNAHRLPVLESSGELVSLISQSLAITAISNNLSKFPVKNKTVAELQLGIKEVLTIREDQNAFDAFRLIHAKKVLGIAVVDANGVLTGNISASDLRQISRADSHIFARLLVPARTFIDAIPQREEVIPGPFCVQAAATVEEVIEKITMTKSHRVYVVDANGHPIGVVSLVDLLKVILENL